MTLIHEQLFADALTPPRAVEADRLSTQAVLRAISEFRVGRSVIVMSGLDANARGVLACAASGASAGTIASMVRHTSGYIYACLDEATCDRLDLPPQVASQPTPESQDCVSVDASADVSTGISARDRAHTLRLLADPDTSAASFTRPGHVVPLRTSTNGVVTRPALAEAALDLARLADLHPAAAIADIVSTTRTWDVARRAELLELGSTHGIASVSIEDVLQYRWRHVEHVEVSTDENVATAFGSIRAVTFRSRLDGRGMIALLPRRLSAGLNVTLTMHTECRTGSVLRTQSCDCKAELDRSLGQLTTTASGIVLYIPAPESPGALATCQRQSNRLPADPSDVDVAAQVLRRLGINDVQLTVPDRNLATGLVASGVSVRIGATRRTDIDSRTTIEG